MGSDDNLKRRKESRKPKKPGKKPTYDSFLIVTEGIETEPAYFNGIKTKILENQKNKDEKNKNIGAITIIGVGRSTKQLVEIAGKKKFGHNHIWLVFDKDNFKDFDETIETIETKKKKTDTNSAMYHVAWSNPCFEYWLCLHLEDNHSTYMDQKKWAEKLEKIFKDNKIGDGKYKKNDKELYEKVSSNGGIHKAINHAKKQIENHKKNFGSNSNKPSNFIPGTTVYELVEELLKYIDD